MIQQNTPELFVRDVDEAVRYYTEALGFQLAGRVPDDPTQPAEWAQVQLGNAAFMFEKAADRPRPEGVAFYLAVEDVDRAGDELRHRGARIVRGPEDMPYGMREITVEDPSGFRLVFMSPVRHGA
ncbi:MAG TPA: VOC family protein [Dehalococcoidia bacterium]